MKEYRGSRRIAPLILSLGITWRIRSASSSDRFTLVERSTGTHGRGGWSGRFVEKKNILSLPGFEPQNVQSVACRCTDYATPQT
jgi:hypothetical protein